MNYSLSISANGQGSVTFVDGDRLVTYTSAHQAFAQAVSSLVAGEDPAIVIQVFEAQVVLAKRVIESTDGNVYVDGEIAAPGLARAIARYDEQGRDPENILKFLDRVSRNPSRRSREQLWEWVSSRDLFVDSDGRILAWKGVLTTDDPEVFTSSNEGTAWVDGVETTGRIPYTVGSVVTIPRFLVDDDPSRHCSEGLHVGSYSYASTFAQRVIEVAVAPEDVVSVPTDSGGQKLRCCRLEVIGVQEKKSPDLGHLEPASTSDSVSRRPEFESALRSTGIPENFLGRLLVRLRGGK